MELEDDTEVMELEDTEVMEMEDDTKEVMELEDREVMELKDDTEEVMELKDTEVIKCSYLELLNGVESTMLVLSYYGFFACRIGKANN